MFTAAQIVAKACGIAKCPGFTVQGGQDLNLTLTDLVEHRNLKVNLVSKTLAISLSNNGPFNLEADYLRTYDLSYTIDGEPYFLRPASLMDYDTENKQTGQASYPYEWATDLSVSPGLLFIYPQSNTATVLTHRYYLKQPEIFQPEGSTVIPWFEDQDYLVMATAMRLMRLTDDARYGAFAAECLQLLDKHLMTEGDEQQVVKEVQLDPRRFRSWNALRPTKLDPF